VKRALATFLLLLCTVGAASTPAAPHAHALMPGDLNAFFAGFVPYAIQRDDIPGAVVAVVRDGKLIFSRGYGYADLKKKTPVLPDGTLFRIGSVSKLFTWTAVMQLVQQHKIDLNANVNQYLDFRIPEPYGPITVADLMTHTPGWEDTARGLWATKLSGLTSLHDYLVNHIPAEIFPPGKTVAYSNYGATLAGYIVQRVSGEPFDTYIDDHILKPLGMNDTTFDQPLPARLKPMMATGYLDASKGKTLPFELVQVWPAGSVSTTADDMARFMIAQLQNGRFDGTQILSPATAKLMHTRHYTLIPGLLNGFDLGFYQENRNGQQIIGHAGDTIVFHSDLHLILDANTGLFMSFNSAGKAGAVEQIRTAIFRAFLDRYFPYTAPPEATVAKPKTDAARVAGYYIASRREESALRLLSRLGETKVAAKPNGEITVGALRDLSGSPIVWREVGPLDYREVGGQTHLRFATDSRGNITYFATDEFIPVMVFQRITGLQSQGSIMLWGGLSIALFVLAIVIWLGTWILRAYYKVPMPMPLGQARLRLASRWGAIAFLALVFGWMNTLQASASNPESIFNMDGTLRVLYVLGLLALFGGIAIAINAVSRLLRGPGGILSRAGELLLGLAGLYGIWAILAFGLANFNFHY
jgi:CubicO group peptidase (beta-lactamase class C family)